MPSKKRHGSPSSHGCRALGRPRRVTTHVRKPEVPGGPVGDDTGALSSEHRDRDGRTVETIRTPNEGRRLARH